VIKIEPFSCGCNGIKENQNGVWENCEKIGFLVRETQRVVEKIDFWGKKIDAWE